MVDTACAGPPLTLAERIEQAEVRLDKVFSLSCEPDFLALSDTAGEALSDWEDLQKDTGLSFRITTDPDDDDYDGELTPEDVAERLFEQDFLGFFVQFSQPIYRKRSEGACGSWGMYTSKWFYGKTVEECIEQALQWGMGNLQEVLGDDGI